MREEGKMSKMIDIKVKDQFSQVTEAKAMLRSFAEHNIHHAAELVKKIEAHQRGTMQYLELE